MPGECRRYLVEHLRLLSLGDRQVRDDVGELPAVGRCLRPLSDDRFGQVAERLVGCRCELEHVGEARALLEPDGEGSVPADQ